MNVGPETVGTTPTPTAEEKYDRPCTFQRHGPRGCHTYAHGSLHKRLAHGVEARRKRIPEQAVVERQAPVEPPWAMRPTCGVTVVVVSTAVMTPPATVTCARRSVPSGSAGRVAEARQA